ncbi:helix-turn-helix domain-containing protein [Caryophanon latum]|uniref:HTH cro/C1-type domain-containing protein n=1 Tax=Caryophanon latum TaxID=33977 RepID=A0A1C0YUX1_9BACL|nr:helix-turn-helix transcriptional regulator [Caryophanon latum]OCS90970.1 hypothetical protein A6K76_10385 [Caryophanon latum]
MSNILAKNIKSIMTSKSMTQQHLAEKLGVSRSYVAMLINGERALTGNLLIEFSKALGVTPKELLYDPNLQNEDYIFYQRGSFESRAARLEYRKMIVEMDNYTRLKEQFDEGKIN